MKTINYLLIALFVFSFCSCKRKLDVSDEDRKKCALVMDSGCSVEELSSFLETCNTAPIISADCDTVCCDDFVMCGVPKDTLAKWIYNYRERIWKKASEFNNEPFTNINQFYDDNNRLDARLVDFPLKELEQYLCYLKGIASDQNKTLGGLGIHYICYDPIVDGNGLKMEGDFGGSPASWTPANSSAMFPGVHTLAFVPYEITDNSIEYWTDSTTYVPGTSTCDPDSPYDNHNWLCPPPRCPTGLNGLIKSSDLQHGPY